MKYVSPLMLSLSMLLCTLNGRAQISFIFTPLSGTYTALNPATATVATGVPTTVTWTTTDEGAYNDIPIGFNFNYIGVIDDSLSCSPNGWARFGANLDPNMVTGGDGWNNNLDNSANYTRPIMAPLWDDYDMEYGEIYYETTGTAPNRVFTLEWDSVEWFWNSNNVAVSFQLKLYETTNIIEFHYLDLPTAPSGTPSASIGLTDVGTGPNNFLSLQDASAAPTVSYTVEADNLGPPATGQIYRFEPPDTDLKAEALTAPDAAGGCYTANETVTVEIRNTGNLSIDFAVDNATLTVDITGAITQTLAETLTSGTLAPGAVMSHTFATTVDMTPAGTYNFDFYTTMAADQNSTNDALPTVNFVVDPIVALPNTVNFFGYTGANLGSVFPNWAEANGTTPGGTTSNWTSSSATQTTAFGFTTARLNLVGTSQNAWIISPRFVPGASDVVSFFSAVTEVGTAAADGSGSNAMAGTDDMVQVMISTDCGLTWTNLYTLDSGTGLSETFAQFTVSLAAYSGQDVMVAFYGTDGPTNDVPSYDIHLSDIFIGTPPPFDLSVTALINPPAGQECYSATEVITVEITNFGTDPVVFSTDNATITVNITGAVVQTFNITLNTGILVSSGVMTVNLPGTLDMSGGGTFNFDASVSMASDGNPSNNALPTQVRDGKLAVALPSMVDFVGYTGANLGALFTGWEEADGTGTPNFTNSNWTSAAAAQQTAFGFNTARLNMTTASNNEWLVSPNFTPVASTVVSFFSALTETGTAAADGAGSNAMAGTDDMVQLMITTDCGATFTTLYTLDGSTGLSESFAPFSVSLAAYAGTECYVAFYGTDGPIINAPDYDIHLSDIFIGTPPPFDLAVTALTSPSAATECYTAAEQIDVEITNFGTDPIDFSTDNATITVMVSGGAVMTLNVTLSSGTLASGASMTVTMPSTVDMSAGGSFDFDASVSMASDGNPSNDVLPTQNRTGKLGVVLPNAVDFTGYTGGNIAIFPGWSEGNGAGTPVNAFGAWIAASASQQVAFGFNTARVGLFGTNRNEWIISPVFTPTTGDGINFYSATTEFGQPQADGNGSNAMAGTDDRVRVMVTADCGNTWTTLYTLDENAGLTENFSYYGVPLGAYTGQAIYVAFYATDGPVDDLPSYDFHVADITIGPLLNLPVELVDFSGENVGNENLLHWTTASESQSEKYQVFREEMDGSLKAIGEVMAAGNSQSLQAYELVDSDPLEGLNRYILKGVDLDGQIYHLGQVEILFRPAPEIQVYPNPFSAAVQFKVMGMEGALDIRIYDLTGRQVWAKKEQVHHGAEIIWDAQNMSSGMYLYRISNGEYQWEGKLEKD